MVSFRDTSIKRKLTLIIMLTSSIALVLASVAFLAYDWYYSRHALLNQMETLVDIVAKNSIAALTFDDPRVAQETLQGLDAEPRIISACLYTIDNRVFSKYHRESQAFQPPPPENDSHRFEQDYLILFKSITYQGDRVGTLYIQSDLREMRDRLRDFGRIVVVFIVGSSLVAFLVGSRLRKVISDPILHLVHQMRLVSDDQNYSVRATRKGEDELGTLMDGFNEMLTQIQNRDVALQSARDGLEERGRALQMELTERRRAEEQITASLQEKEVLLQEIHHRVKNNLQVISSLLDLQADATADERLIDPLRESRDRVRSMALIHESLYHSDDLAQLDLGDYIRDLTSNLLSSYSVQASDITLTIDVADISLTVDAAIPCGLIINELISNALKYAFSEGEHGL